MIIITIIDKINFRQDKLVYSMSGMSNNMVKMPYRASFITE